jgi:hypothetical protein
MRDAGYNVTIQTYKFDYYAYTGIPSLSASSPAHDVQFDERLHRGRLRAFHGRPCRPGRPGATQLRGHDGALTFADSEFAIASQSQSHPAPGPAVGSSPAPAAAAGEDVQFLERVAGAHRHAGQR